MVVSNTGAPRAGEDASVSRLEYLIVHLANIIRRFYNLTGLVDRIQEHCVYIDLKRLEDL